MVDKLFSVQTKGIKRRSKMYRAEWDGHIESTKKVVASCFHSQLETGKRLSILGSGQLLDFPKEIQTKFSPQITLIDRSKEALGEYSSNAIVYDLTGTLDTWSTYLASLKKISLNNFLEQLKTIQKKLPLLKEPIFRDELVLSLNILSQLPVYWQDSVFSIIKKHYSKKIAKEREDDIIQALRPSSSALIKSHLHALVPKGRHKASLLITDTHYLKYFLKTTKLTSIPYLSLKNESESIQELDLRPSRGNTLNKIEAMDALFGVSIEQQIGSLCEISLKDRWLWDIIPYGREENGAGTAHRVVGLWLT